MGEKVTLVCRPGSEIDKRSREANIPVLNLPLKGAADLNSARKLAAYCEKNDIGIIHAHLGRDYWTAVLAKLFNPKLKVVITRHVLIPTKSSLLHKWIYSKIDKVIAVSQAVKKTLTNFPPKKIVTIYNGIDTDRFATAQSGSLRKELDLAENTRIVGMVGHVSPHKGHAIFIKSIPEITANNPDTVFVVIGDDFKNGEYISQLKNLDNRVHFLGPRANIPDLMKDLDVFVLASANEPFGLVTVEAMASGTPVVATNSGGTVEIITDRETGILIPPNDPSELAKAVVRILNDDELANKLRANGQTRVRALFDLKTMAVNTVGVYREIERS